MTDKLKPIANCRECPLCECEGDGWCPLALAVMAADHHRRALAFEKGAGQADRPPGWRGAIFLLELLAGAATETNTVSSRGALKRAAKRLLDMANDLNVELQGYEQRAES